MMARLFVYLTLLGICVIAVFWPVNLSLAINSCGPAGTICTGAPSSCTPSNCASPCTFCGSATTSFNSIPCSLYDNSSCSGASTLINTLPFTDLVSGSPQHSLPTTTAGYYYCGQTSITCPGGTVCLPGEPGSNAQGCCTPDGSCAANTCQGQNCTDGCGYSYPGSAYCSCPFSYITAQAYIYNSHPNTTADNQSGQWCFLNPVYSVTDVTQPTSCQGTGAIGAGCSINVATVNCSTSFVLQNACGSYGGTCPSGNNPSLCASNCAQNTYWSAANCSCECLTPGSTLEDEGASEYGGGDVWGCKCPASIPIWDGTACRACQTCEDNSPGCC